MFTVTLAFLLLTVCTSPTSVSLGFRLDIVAAMCTKAVVAGCKGRMYSCKARQGRKK